ncbi:MAG: hypothetical protein AAFQ12_13625, partial [Pseudomonadota bacterium]
MLTRSIWVSALAIGLSACANIDLQSAEAPSVKPDLTESGQAEVASDPIIGPGDRMPSGRDIGTRSAVVAPNAAAATAHPLATQTALDVMKDGGTAVAAAAFGATTADRVPISRPEGIRSPVPM